METRMRAVLLIVIFASSVVIESVLGAENYIDYGNDRLDFEKAQQLYRMLLQKRVDTEKIRTFISENFRPRASERSPSYRMRFGRSDPKLPPMNLLAKMRTAELARTDDEN